MKDIRYKYNFYDTKTNTVKSQAVAHSRIFRLFMKGKYDACVLWPLYKRVKNWIEAPVYCSKRKPYNLDYINVAWPIWSNVTIKAIKDKCVKKGLSCHRVALFASAQAPNNMDHFLPLGFFPCTVEWILILLSVPQIHW